jgi:phosphoenolpyruvate carboxykinase (ATP)
MWRALTRRSLADLHDLTGHSSMTSLGFTSRKVFRNLAVPEYYERSMEFMPANPKTNRSVISSTGALVAYSSVSTGRSPKDKRIVKEASTEHDIWWGSVNVPLSQHSWEINKQRAIDYLNNKSRLYVVDGYAGWDPENRIKVRVIATRAYHALFMHNMMIRPTKEELARDFANGADYNIINAGEFPANRLTEGMSSATSVDLNFAEKKFVILGTQYAGEMKKGLFTIMNYLMPKKGVASFHASANEGPNGDTTLLFGLSGTGKTTLSADPNRRLIGDDEHCWSDKGVFNIEGGCYAKAVGLDPKKEPEIFEASKFGAILENISFFPGTRDVNYDDISLTENTRLCYPLEYMPYVKTPAIGGHPKNIIFLTCDAYGVLPPVSKLTPEQAMYHFMAGYTAKVAGTEVGVKEPSPTFSACFGEAFLVWHPSKYAELLSEKLKKHGAQTWLINTGWTGGKYGVGKRMSLPATRKIIDAIHSGELAKVQTETSAVFNLHVPVSCPGVDPIILSPRNTWTDRAAYDATLKQLAAKFIENFEKYRESSSPEIFKAGPHLN